MALEDENYMMFTSFRRDGRAVGTPVWLVPLGPGEFGFSTTRSTGKVKRLGHTSRVTVQACDRRGQSTHGPLYEATARVVEGEELAAIRAAIQAKYRVMSTLIAVGSKVFARMPGGGDAERVGISVTLAASDA